MSNIKQYQGAVDAIKTAILQSQVRAAKAVNQEQLALYYGIGRYVSANTRKKNWGQGAIEAISNQLKLELRIFYEGWCMLERPNSAVTTAEFTDSNTISSVTTDEFTEINMRPLVAADEMDPELLKALSPKEELQRVFEESSRKEEKYMDSFLPTDKNTSSKIE